jgi:hypothetical protein
MAGVDPMEADVLVMEPEEPEEEPGEPEAGQAEQAEQAGSEDEAGDEDEPDCPRLCAARAAEAAEAGRRRPGYADELLEVWARGARSRAARIRAAEREQAATRAAARAEETRALEREAFRLGALDLVYLLRGPFFARREERPGAADTDVVLSLQPRGRAGELMCVWEEGNLVMRTGTDPACRLSAAGVFLSRQADPENAERARAERLRVRYSRGAPLPKGAGKAPPAPARPQAAPVEEIRDGKMGVVRVPVELRRPQRVRGTLGRDYRPKKKDKERPPAPG